MSLKKDRDVIRGVPQGFVISLFFLSCLNDIVEGFTFKIAKFVGDTSLTGKVTTPSE